VRKVGHLQRLIYIQSAEKTKWIRYSALVQTAERRQVSLRMLFSAMYFLIYKKRYSNCTRGLWRQRSRGSGQSRVEQNC